MILRRLLPLCVLAALGVFALMGDDIKGDDDLPPDAKKLIDEHDKAADAILGKAETALKKAQEDHVKAQEEVKDRRAKLVAALEALAARLEKEGKTNQSKVIADQAEEIKTGRIAGAQPSPGTLTGFRNQVGKSFVFDVTGQVGAGTVWGTDIYTDDSALASVVVHAGVLKNGERGAVKVTVLPGEQSYQGSTRNGVTTNNYNQWDGSYKVEPYRRGKRGGGQGGGKGGGGAGAMADPGTLQNFRGQVGKTLLFEVTGAANGAVWGTGVYTDDSSLATAAVHAGVLKAGEKGVVKVTIQAGQQAYQNSTQNGVTSGNWDDWGGSYSVEKAPK